MSERGVATGNGALAQSEMIAEAIPTTFPDASMTGPPLLPLWREDEEGCSSKEAWLSHWLCTADREVERGECILPEYILCDIDVFHVFRPSFKQVSMLGWLVTE